MNDRLNVRRSLTKSSWNSAPVFGVGVCLFAVIVIAIAIGVIMIRYREM